MLELIRITLLLAFAFLYAYFDVFNKRNIPDKVVYLSLAVGIISTILYPLKVAEISFLLALFVGSLGYILYKAGMLGLGDGLELTFISLVLPVQPTPLFNMGLSQLNMPFVLSVFISSGIVTIIAVPIYYIIRGDKINLKPSNIIKASIVFTSYMVLLLFVYLLFGLRIDATIFIMLMAIFSTIIFLFENSINESMVEWIYPKYLEEDDIIATNLMSKKEIDFFKSKFNEFGRLATKKQINALKNVKKKLPVYRKAIPFAVFILAGVIVSLLFGDLLFLLFT